MGNQEKKTEQVEKRSHKITQFAQQKNEGEGKKNNRQWFYQILEILCPIHFWFSFVREKNQEAYDG